jgi:hypothetical protein
VTLHRRLEMAKRPDWRLDAEIHALIGGMRGGLVPDYTRDTDEARTVVRPGCRLDMTVDSRGCTATVHQLVEDWWVQHVGHNPRSLALAVCAAAVLERTAGLEKAEQAEQAA